jgi:hypothetical protein
MVLREWLMGYPLGWTDLEDSATRSSRKLRNSLGEGLAKQQERGMCPKGKRVGKKKNAPG